MKPDIRSAGIVNETGDCSFLVFLDYDNVSYEKVKKDLRLLSEAKGICTFVVLVNGEEELINEAGELKLVGSYNVLTFCKKHFRDCEDAIGMTRCDDSFKTHIRYYTERNHVIRLACKYRRDGSICRPAPKIKDILALSGKCAHDHARSHVELVEGIFGVSLQQFFRRLDDSGEVEVIKYNTQEKKPG